jgi:hypothetical protein
MNPADPDHRAIIDAEHVRLLAIFHFVAAGLAFMGLAFSFFYFVMFEALLSSPQIWAESQEGPPPEVFMGFFRFFIVMFVLWFLVAAVGNLLSGLFLRARRHRIFSIVIAAINCLHVPIGTALGIFTLIVLGRASVRRLYEP